MQNPRLSLPRETSRLILRPATPADAVAVHEAVEESFEDLHPWMPWAVRLHTLEETKAYLEGAEAKFKSGEDFPAGAFLKETGGYVLGTGLHPRDWNVPKFEIGYWCRTSMQGRGYATETVRALTRIAVLEMGAKRLEIRCDARNEASRRVAERAGYRLEAVLHRDERANDGSLRDTLVYALLADELGSTE